MYIECDRKRCMKKLKLLVLENLNLNKKTQQIIEAFRGVYNFIKISLIIDW